LAKPDRGSGADEGVCPTLIYIADFRDRILADDG
jgi:hypothetical protein